MILCGYHVPSALYTLYVAAVKEAYTTPSVDADYNREMAHSELLTECGINRNNEEFNFWLTREVGASLESYNIVRYLEGVI